MPYLDDLYGGSKITEHIARTPGLAREMRYSPSNAWNQAAQNYLGPLAAEDFAADARRSGDLGGVLAALGSPAYAAIKAAAPEFASRTFGTGEALPSEAGLDQVLRAYRGLFRADQPQPTAPTARQPADEAITPGVGQRVDWGRDPAWWQASGHFTPNDVLPTAAAALGGVAGLARSGVPGLAWEAVKQAGGAAMRDPAERIFDAGRNFIGGPSGGVPGWLKAALGAAGVGGAVEGAKWFAKEAPRR